MILVQLNSKYGGNGKYRYRFSIWDERDERYIGGFTHQTIIATRV